MFEEETEEWPVQHAAWTGLRPSIPETQGNSNVAGWEAAVEKTTDFVMEGKTCCECGQAYSQAEALC